VNEDQTVSQDRPRRRWIPPLIAGLTAHATLAAALASAQGTALLPDVSVHLEAARYAPAEEDFRYTGWIGAGVGLVRVDDATAYFKADLETILGDRPRAFGANQANYHLELGLRFSKPSHEVTAFFHHVSRHAIDRPKIDAVDWNVLGLRLAGRLADLPVPLRGSLSVGHTTLASLVGYRFEVVARLEAELVHADRSALYLLPSARLVTVEESDDFPRGSFVDVSVEAGVRWLRQGRSLQAFVAYEHRNDVLLLAPATHDRALLGFRVGFARAESPPFP
jgi:hypothetical protein